MAIVKKSKVTKVAPASVPVATAKAAKATTAQAEKVTNIAASKYKGITTGMRVMEYQDATFAANMKAMLTDEELVADWRREFPNAVAFTVNHLAGARRDYNNGRHSKNAAKPATPLGGYVIVAGKRVAAATVAPAPKAAKTPAAPKTPATAPASKPAATPAKAPAAPSAPAKAPTATGTAKAVRRMPKAS